MPLKTPALFPSETCNRPSLFFLMLNHLLPLSSSFLVRNTLLLEYFVLTHPLSDRKTRRDFPPLDHPPRAVHPPLRRPRLRCGRRSQADKEAVELCLPVAQRVAVVEGVWGKGVEELMFLERIVGCRLLGFEGTCRRVEGMERPQGLKNQRNRNR